MNEKLIRAGGHMATIGLATLVYFLGGGAVISIATGATAGILKDELQARIWYPKMFEGWVLTRNYAFRYEQFPGQDFYMTWSDVVQDENGSEMERRKHGQSHFKVGKFYGIPEEVVRNIMTQFPLKTIRFK